MKINILYFSSVFGSIKALYFGFWKIAKLLILNIKNIADYNQI